MKWFDVLWRLGEGALWNMTRQLDRWRWQLLQSLLLVLLAAVCALAVLLLAAGLALLTFWDTHRYEVLWALLLAYGALALGLVRHAGRMVGHSVEYSSSSTKHRCCAARGCGDDQRSQRGGCAGG